MFKILTITFISHQFFENLNINFVDVNEQNEQVYKSLIIGPNGTGKSKILLALIEIFTSLKNYKQGKYSFTYQYKIEYICNETTYIVEYINTSKVIKPDFKLFVNGSVFKGGQIGLPSKVLISSFSFNDKYPLRKNRGRIINDDYYYLGLKSTTNNIFLGKPIRDVISNFYQAIEAGKNIEPIRQLFSELDLYPELKIVYGNGKNYKFLLQKSFFEDSPPTVDNFRSLFLDYLQNKNKRRLGDEKVEKILKDDFAITAVIEYLSKNLDSFLKVYEREVALHPCFNFNKPETYKDFTDRLKILKLLSDLEIFKFEKT